MLASTARRCCRESLQTASDLRQLQVRWGTISCRNAILPKAEQLLNERAAELEAPVSKTEKVISLGNMKFRLVISDEQAKANINMISSMKGKDGLQKSLQQLQADQNPPLLLKLPINDSNASGGNKAKIAYTCFDQIFVDAHPSDFLKLNDHQQVLTDRITCWSDGRVNFRRADPLVLREMLRGFLTESQVTELQQRCLDTPDITLYEAVKQLDLGRTKAMAAGSILTDTSNSHSLWIIVEGKTRNWYSFSVSNGSRHFASTKTRSFTW